MWPPPRAGDDDGSDTAAVETGDGVPNGVGNNVQLSEAPGTIDVFLPFQGLKLNNWWPLFSTEDRTGVGDEDHLDESWSDKKSNCRMRINEWWELKWVMRASCSVVAVAGWMPLLLLLLMMMMQWPRRFGFCCYLSLEAQTRLPRRPHRNVQSQSWWGRERQVSAATFPSLYFILYCDLLFAVCGLRFAL